MGESYIYHDRLSHSLKVAQVARSLAEILRNERTYTKLSIDERVDPDVCETAALAHDFGHPPFGHAAEQELDELVPEYYGGFEGNAQSFRIVTSSATHQIGDPGLNLTLASCNALLKYPWGWKDKEKHEDGDKWGYYPTEKGHFDRVRKLGPGSDEMCLEAQVMDYADDLTYAIHDVEDFYRTGLIPLDQLLVGTGERDRVADYLHDKRDIKKGTTENVFDTLQKRMTTGEELETPFRGRDREISELNRFTSNLIEKYLAPDRATEVYVDEDAHKLVVDERFKTEITVLKELTFFYVIDNPSLMSQQRGQRRVIRRLYECLSEAADPDEPYDNVIPLPFRNRIANLDQHQEMERTRIVVDLIARMTERQALSFYQRIEGNSPGSLREGILL